MLEQDIPMDFCAHDEGTDDVGPIRDEDQGGTTREYTVWIHSADVDLEGRVRLSFVPVWIRGTISCSR